MTDGPIFPIHLKTADFEAPDEPNYFLVSEDGLHIVRDTPLYSSCVPCPDGVPGLEKQPAYCRLRFPPIPGQLVEQAVGFFRECYDRWRSEGVVILFYAAPADGQPARFAFDAPPQTIPGWYDYKGQFRASLRLDYESCPRPGPEFVKLGTFHSHAEFGPGHSGTDVHDESNETGLHLTAGYVHSDRPEFTASFVVSGTRFRIEPENVMSSFEKRRPFPTHWINRVTLAPSTWSSTSGTSYGAGSEGAKYG